MQRLFLDLEFEPSPGKFFAEVRGLSVRASSLFATISFCIAASGCGISLPQLDLLHPVDVRSELNQDFDTYVQSIAEHVVCEVRYAADTTYQSSPLSPRHILKYWAAKVELNINATETGGFSPGLSAFTRAADFVFGVNGKIETQGVNNVSLTYFLPFKQIISNLPHTPDSYWPYTCDKPSPHIKQPIEGTLGIQSILVAGLRLYDTEGFVAANLKSGPFDTISKTVSFQITTSGGLNPAWKFTNLSIVTPGPLASASRVSLNKLIITMGPNTLGTNTEVIVGRKGRILVQSAPIRSTPLDESFFIERLRGVLSSPIRE